MKPTELEATMAVDAAARVLWSTRQKEFADAGIPQALPKRIDDQCIGGH